MSKCLGCGIKLQVDDPKEIGFTEKLDNKFCERCFKLKNYGEYTGVSLSNKDYQKNIQGIPSDSLVVYVSDLLSLNLSNVPNFPNILLVLTKRDILPKSVKEEKIIRNIKEKYSSFLDIICVSSLKNYHMDQFYRLLLEYAKGQAIYFIGATNSGKSTLINKLIGNYGGEGQTPDITISMYPSTTLDKIEIHLEDLKIIDTPGLIEEGNLVNNLTSKELKKVTIKKEIKPKSCQVEGRGSILIDNYVRIDYQTEGFNSFVIYTANSVRSSFISMKNSILRDQESYHYSLTERQDLVIPGLGFVKFVEPIDITVYVVKNVKLFIRDNLI